MGKKSKLKRRVKELEDAVEAIVQTCEALGTRALDLTTKSNDYDARLTHLGNQALDFEESLEVANGKLDALRRADTLADTVDSLDDTLAATRKGVELQQEAHLTLQQRFDALERLARTQAPNGTPFPQESPKVDELVKRITAIELLLKQHQDGYQDMRNKVNDLDGTVRGQGVFFRDGLNDAKAAVASLRDVVRGLSANASH